MNVADLIKEPYNRRARLYPALLTLLPVFVVVPFLYPGFEAQATAIVVLCASLGGAMWLTQIGRERGKRLEPALFESWGGKPSVAFLRHRDTTVSAATKKRYLGFLSRKVGRFRSPSEQDEKNSPESADDMYQSATDWLVANTRDTKKFALLFEENMNYGFRRNLWALKPVALCIDLLAIIAAGGHIWWTRGISNPTALLDLSTLIALGVPAVHLLIVLALVTKSWVKTTAEAYARQLLAACDVL